MSTSFADTSTTTIEEQTDRALLERVRVGDSAAYGVMYERHAPTARRFARSLVQSDVEADDVVSEAFTAVLAALERGKGPIDTFVPYLMNTVRHECYRVLRNARRESLDRNGICEAAGGGGDVHVDTYAGVDEAAVVRDALVSLPPALRHVLWRIEVDHASPADVSRERGGTPNAAAVLASRARQAFANAYLQQHVAPFSDRGAVDTTCREVRPHLAAFVRATLGVRRRRRLEEHLETCASCTGARESLGRMNQHLRSTTATTAAMGDLAAPAAGVSDTMNAA